MVISEKNKILISRATQFNNGGNDSIKNWQIKTSGPVNMQQMFQAASNFNLPNGLLMTGQTSRIFQNSRPGIGMFGTAGTARTYLTSTLPSGPWTISGDTVIP